MPSKTTKRAIQLTPRQHQLLKMVACFQENRCYSPTLGEMASELNLSRSTVYEHITELRKKDLLCAWPNRARSLTLTSRARELLSTFSDPSLSVGTKESVGMPLAGRVAAGVPLEAVEDVESLSLNSCFGSGDDLFALEVRGQSMINEDIREGDYVICRRSRVAHNGQLVVAIVDNDNATLKRFYKEKTHARLQPANDNFQPIYSDNCRIEAVVIGLVRKF
jgi:repressor LexA